MLMYRTAALEMKKSVDAFCVCVYIRAYICIDAMYRVEQCLFLSSAYVREVADFVLPY
uniref:Uncharacterized protein n=1 Tax=Anguilla anguilla TaxID=7936 RepID=A0A0E9W7S1_ANGAN